MQAVEIIERQFPDLILMNTAMPVPDESSATMEIRKFERGRQIPVIAVCGRGEHLYEMASEAGCRAVITEPIDFDEPESFFNQYLAG